MSGNPGTEALHKYRPMVSCDTRTVKFDDVLTTCYRAKEKSSGMLQKNTQHSKCFRKKVDVDVNARNWRKATEKLINTEKNSQNIRSIALSDEKKCFL